MRQCPTLEGDARSLIMHKIGVDVCMSRQRGFYHKCHRCAFRGKPASFKLEPSDGRDVPFPVEAGAGARAGEVVGSSAR